MSNWLMFNMINGHAGNSDPRINYYFYRQVDNTPGFDSAADEEVLECGLPGYYVPPQLRGDNSPFVRLQTLLANLPTDIGEEIMEMIMEFLLMDLKEH